MSVEGGFCYRAFIYRDNDMLVACQNVLYWEVSVIEVSVIGIRRTFFPKRSECVLNTGYTKRETFSSAID